MREDTETTIVLRTSNGDQLACSAAKLQEKGAKEPTILLRFGLLLALEVIAQKSGKQVFG
jgi:hypothetical protein